MTVNNDELWNRIVKREGKVFRTHRGKEFTYHIKRDRDGELRGEMVIDRNRITITRATVLLAYHNALELLEKKGTIKKPEKLGAYGAVYLYPIFLDVGIEGDGLPEEEKPPEEAVRTCSFCGYTTQEEFDFCPKCGHRF